MENYTFVAKPYETVKEEMIAHIRSINKVLPKEYLDKLELKQLLNECHPTYRELFVHKIKSETDVEKEND